MPGSPVPPQLGAMMASMIKPPAGGGKPPVGKSKPKAEKPAPKKKH